MERQTHQYVQNNQQKTPQQISNRLFDPKTQKYFSKLLLLNGHNLFAFQTSHIMVVYFIIQGLATTNNLKLVNKEDIIKYIKSLQLPNGGFAPSSLYTGYQKEHQLNIPHIVFTYSAVNIMRILGRLEQISKDKCLASVHRCFKPNGSFSNFKNSNQADLRFVYAALAICNAFQDFTFVDKQKVKKYVQSCRNYDGGYGLRPYCQSHAGAIYCAIASYKMLNLGIPHQYQTLEFLVNRQTVNSNSNVVGVQGRVGKLPDSCYTFWVGASIKIMTGQNLLSENVDNFVKLCYNSEGFNFSKYPNTKGDPLHTLHSIVGLKIIHQNDKDMDIIQGTTNIGENC